MALYLTDKHLLLMTDTNKETDHFYTAEGQQNGSDVVSKDGGFKMDCK